MAYKTCPHCGAAGSIHNFPTGNPSHCLACGATSGFFSARLLRIWQRFGMQFLLGVAGMFLTYCFGFGMGYDARQPTNEIPESIGKPPSEPADSFEHLSGTFTHLSLPEGERLLTEGTMQDWSQLKPEARLALCRGWARHYRLKYRRWEDDDAMLERSRKYFLALDHEWALMGTFRQIEEKTIPAPRILGDYTPLVEMVILIEGREP